MMTDRFGKAMTLAPLLCAGWLWGQALAQAPVGRPSGGGNNPEDLDTISGPMTAATTQTQAGAIAGATCNFTICYVSTANLNDGVALHLCPLAPSRVTIINGSGNAIKVYGSGTDTIDGVATATGVTLPAASATLKAGTAEFTCAVGGTAAKWFSH